VAERVALDAHDAAHAFVHRPRGRIIGVLRTALAGGVSLPRGQTLDLVKSAAHSLRASNLKRANASMQLDRFDSGTVSH
jgi:hypothetical protein